MSNNSDRKSLLIILFVFLFVTVGTYITILFARGYRPNFESTKITLKANGLISATSKPKGASVYLDDKLITATDDVINLSPDNYHLKIIKDGYLPWQKNIRIKKEVVFQTDAQLFRSLPELRPITQTGAINPVISPDFSKIIYSVASASATADNGLYIIELDGSPISLGKNIPKQLAKNFPGVDWSKATFTFSPDSRQIIASFKEKNQNYLIDLNSTVSSTSLTDITSRLPIIKTEWSSIEKNIIATRLDRLPEAIKPLVSTNSAKFISLSPEEDKVLFLAANDGLIPSNIITPPPAQSTQPQSRTIQKNHFYVYDLKDDANFLIGNYQNLNNIFWFPNSNNLIFTQDQSIKAVDYDATNLVTLFNGDFDSKNVFPGSDGTKIIVLTSAYSGSAKNLYAITVR